MHSCIQTLASRTYSRQLVLHLSGDPSDFFVSSQRVAPITARRWEYELTTRNALDPRSTTLNHNGDGIYTAANIHCRVRAIVYNSILGFPAGRRCCCPTALSNDSDFSECLWLYSSHLKSYIGAYGFHVNKNAIVSLQPSS